MKNNINISETAVCYFRSAVAGPGIAEQEEACRRFAARQGLSVRATYSDVGSGLQINRGLRALIDALHVHPVGQLIITDPARLSRNRLLDMTLLDLFREMGVRLRIVDQEKDR